MAMPFSSARPVEYDSYVPEQRCSSTSTSCRTARTRSAPTCRASPSCMTRNPAWKQSTDTIRHQYVNQISLTLGVTSATTQLADKKAGTYDLVHGHRVRPGLHPGDAGQQRTRSSTIWPWSNIFPYIMFNLQSPNASGAMEQAGGAPGHRVRHRQGDRAEGLRRAARGQSSTRAIPPGNVGYLSSNPYPTTTGTATSPSASRCSPRPAYSSGLSLTTIYADDSVNTRQFEAIQASLKPCGINLAGKPSPGQATSSPWATPRRTSPASGTLPPAPAGSPTGTASTAGRSSRRSSRPTA